MDASLETNLIETNEAAIGSNELDNAIANGMVLDDAGSNEAIATGMVTDNAGFNDTGTLIETDEAADTCTTCHKTLQNFINLKKHKQVTHTLSNFKIFNKHVMKHGGDKFDIKCEEQLTVEKEVGEHVDADQKEPDPDEHLFAPKLDHLLADLKMEGGCTNTIATV